MSSKVFRHKPLAPDEQIGRVEPDGKVYEALFGPDKYVGHVEVDTGKVFEARFGPDKEIGRVTLDNGKAYRAKFGPDEYVGHADGDGKLYRHKPLAADEYLGHIQQMPAYAHAGAALLLLVLPAWEAARAEVDAAQAAAKQSAEEAKAAQAAPHPKDNS